MTRTVLGLAPLTLALCMTMVACGDDVGDTAATSDETTSGDGDGDGDASGTDSDSASGDGDGDATSGDGDGDSTTESESDTDPGPDSDMDGVSDAADNCPDTPNPNQLDFDGNGMGNVCDIQIFTNVSGNLNTTAEADTQFGGCIIPLMIMVESGEVRVQLDDDAAVAAFEITTLNIADLPPQNCSIGGLIDADVSLTNFVITNNGGEFPVAMPHTSAQHDGGQVAGDSDMPHPVLASSDLIADIGMGPTESALDLDGALPVFTANITEAGAMGVISWADAQFVVAQTTLEEGLPVPLDFELRGLVGALTLMP